MDKMKDLLYKLLFGLTPFRMYLGLNIANVCSRKCGFCPYHAPNLPNNEHTRWFLKQPDFLDYQKFEQSFKKWHWLVKRVSITGKGEPMMHPDFMKFCELIDSFFIPYTITTNGDFELKGLNNLYFLQYIRVSVYDNPQKWILAKKYSDLPIELYNQTGTHIDGMIDGITTKNFGAKGTMEKDFNKNKSCNAPYSFVTMNTDGSIVPCYSYHEVGRWDLLKARNSKEMRKWRRSKLPRVDSDCFNCLGCKK